MVPAIIEGIKTGIPGVVHFLDARFKTGDFISVSSMRPIKEENLNETDSIGEYGCMEVKSFECEEELEK